MNITIKTIPAFDRNVYKYMSKEAFEDFLNFIAENPNKGQSIPGTGGVRKVRWENGINNKVKSGGARILYHYSKDVLILLITLYGKSKKENISDNERNELKQTIPLLVAKYIGEL